MNSRNLRKHRLAVVSCAAVALVTALPVQAEWYVQDREARRTLKSIEGRIGEGDVNRRLREIYDQQRINQFKADNEGTKAAEDPKLTLDDENASASVTMDEDTRCPSPGSAPVAQQQWQLCKEIHQTEIAQYQYSVKMFELTRKRQQYLDLLKQQRAGFGAHETGKLHDNTNRVLLLMSQMEIDRQQQRTYMDAYAARLNYLNQMSKTMSQHALEGNKGSGGGIGSLITGLVGGIALDAALDAAQSRRHYNF